jgi:serine protease DegS
VDVVAASPAAVAGIRPEDIIVTIDGLAVGAAGDLQAAMVGSRAGTVVRIQLVRHGNLMTVSVTPEELEV